MRRCVLLLGLLTCAAACGKGCGGKDEVQKEALRRSGVSVEDAFSIDSVNIYDRLGLETFKQFSREFYTRVYNDPEEWYRDLFKGHPIEDSIANQYTFLVQRMGGPPFYRERKGCPMMMRRHAPYPCNETTAERWLMHAGEAFDALGDAVDADSRRRMENFFRFFAYFLVVGQEQGHGSAAGCHGGQDCHGSGCTPGSTVGVSASGCQGGQGCGPGGRGGASAGGGGCPMAGHMGWMGQDRWPGRGEIADSKNGQRKGRGWGFWGVHGSNLGHQGAQQGNSEDSKAQAQPAYEKAAAQDQSELEVEMAWEGDAPGIDRALA